MSHMPNLAPNLSPRRPGQRGLTALVNSLAGLATYQGSGLGIGCPGQNLRETH